LRAGFFWQTVASKLAGRVLFAAIARRDAGFNAVVFDRPVTVSGPRNEDCLLATVSLSIEHYHLISVAEDAPAKVQDIGAARVQQRGDARDQMRDETLIRSLLSLASKDADGSSLTTALS
jgi:hypothetical protein